MKKTRTIRGYLLLVLTAVFACRLYAGAVDSNSRPAEKNLLLHKDTRNVTVKEVTAQGGSRKEAVKNAICMAVEQVRGIKIDSGSYDFGALIADVEIDKENKDKKTIEFDAVNVAAEGTLYTTKISGLVKSYEILEEKQIDEKSYQVKMKVAVYDYSADELRKRVKIALMPVKTTDNEYKFLDLATPAQTLSALLNQKIAVALTQTNKFYVLDRESIIEFARENNILLALDAPLEEQAKLTETLGADYMLIGTISQAEIRRIDKYLKTADYTSNRFKARLTFNYRLVDGKTKQIVMASVVEKYLEDENVRAIADEINPDEWNPSQMRDALLTIAANEVIEQIIGKVYPIRIASVERDGNIVLNQGGERMAEGTLLDVFTEGKEIIDADTKESIGKVESKIASIEITRVEPTMSFAKIIDGDPSGLKKGLICRVKISKGQGEAGMKPDIEKTKEGGVILPFDK